jgi:hypothetical protein
MSDESSQAILQRLDRIELEIKEVKITNDAYQKASDRVANLAFTVITAAAAVTVLSPAVKIFSEYLTR